MSRLDKWGGGWKSSRVKASAALVRCKWWMHTLCVRINKHLLIRRKPSSIRQKVTTSLCWLCTIPGRTTSFPILGAMKTLSKPAPYAGRRTSASRCWALWTGEHLQRNFVLFLYYRNWIKRINLMRVAPLGYGELGFLYFFFLPRSFLAGTNWMWCPVAKQQFESRRPFAVVSSEMQQRRILRKVIERSSINKLSIFTHPVLSSTGSQNGELSWFYGFLLSNWCKERDIM